LSLPRQVDQATVAPRPARVLPMPKSRDDTKPGLPPPLPH
jgi:hypothetical protein